MNEIHKDTADPRQAQNSMLCPAASHLPREACVNARHHRITEAPGPFRRLALSGDGNTLIAATRRIICLFNTRTRERFARYVFDCDIDHIAINDDGQVVFAADAMNAIHVIDVPFSYRSQALTHGAEITALAVDSTGSRLALADANGQVSVLDTLGFSKLSGLDYGFDLHRMVIRGDEDLLLGYAQQQIVACRLSSAERLAHYGEDCPQPSRQLTDEYLVTETKDGLIVFDSNSSESRHLPVSSVRAYAATPDGSLVVSAHRGVLILWDSSRCAEIRRFETYVHEVGDIQICADGQAIYVCGDDAAIDCFSVNGERLATYSDFQIPIMAAATTDDDRKLVVADEAGSLAVYDLVSGAAARYHPHVCCISKLCVQDSLAATGAHDGWARVLDLDSGEEVFAVSFAGVPVQAVTLDGVRYLVTGNYLGQVNLYDLETRQLLREFHGNRRTVRSLAVSPCRRYLMSTNENGEVLIFDYQSAELINQLPGFGNIYSGGFDESGDFVYYGDGLGKIMQARSVSPEIINSWSPHKSGVRWISIHGDKLLSVGISDSLHLLDLTSGKTLLDCPLSAKPFHRVAFMNRSGTRLVSGGQDGCLRFHAAGDGSIQAQLHNLAHGFLWLTCKDETTAEHGDSFWTDQQELISVYAQVAGIETLLAPSSDEYREYIEIHNNRAATMSRVGMTPAATRQAGHYDSPLDWMPGALLELLPDPE